MQLVHFSLSWLQQTWIPVNSVTQLLENKLYLMPQQFMETLRPINIKRVRQLTQTTLFSPKRKKRLAVIGGLDYWNDL